MVHHKIQAAINRRSEHALRALLLRLWLISTGKTKKRLQRMILGHDGAIVSRKKHKRKRSGHPQRRKSKSKRKHKLSKAAARARFKKLLPKINAGRRKKGLKPIHFK